MKPLVLMMIVLLGIIIDDCTQDIEPPPNLNREANATLSGSRWDVILFSENGFARDLSNIDIWMVFDDVGKQSGRTEWYVAESGQIDSTYQYNYFITNEGTCIELDGYKMDLWFEDSQLLLNLEGILDGIRYEIIAESG